MYTRKYMCIYVCMYGYIYKYVYFNELRSIRVNVVCIYKCMYVAYTDKRITKTTTTREVVPGPGYR